MPIGFFSKYLVISPVFPRKSKKKKVSGAFDTPNIKVGQMCDIWKNRPWSGVDARTSFFLIFSQFDLFFPGKVIKIGVFRWFKFTLKPPYRIAIGNFFSAIWDTSHWNFLVKFGLKTV